MSTRRVARPAVLAKIPADRHAVIEASAGTGKTFTLEHLVVDLLLGTDVTLDQILVVTFTEKATIELRARVRATLDRLAAPPAEAAEPPPGAPAWAIDDAARDKLTAASGAFEAATITTIHAFCQRVLRDNAFFSGRLFDEKQVDGREAFARAFREALRRDVATHPERTVWLEAALRSGSSIDDIEQLLWDCANVRGEVRPTFDPEALAAALEAFPVDEARSAVHIDALKKGGIAAVSAGPIARKINALAGAVESSREARSLPRFVELASQLEAPDWVTKVRGARLTGRTAALCAAAVALVEATPTFEAAIANAILPAVLAGLDRRKRDAGEYDFDDMLSRVDEALRGPSGGALGRALRRRWRYALIDEFQDTDEVQWRIFHRAFFDPEPPRSVVYLVGDPKQSIYRFRGADVETYLAARQIVVDAKGTRVALDSTFRATAAMAGALNTIFDQSAADPIFTGAVQYEPVTCGRTDRTLVDGDGSEVTPVHLFRTEGNPMPDALGPFIAREIAAITAPARPWRLGGEPVAHSDIFVLTRNRYDGRYVAEHLRKAGIPFAFFKEDGLFTTDEAKDVGALLRAVEDPADKSRRFAAWLTPFFGLTLAGLEDARELPASHPCVARLGEWKALGDARDYGRLFESIVRDSGFVRREIFFEDSERELTNYLHIFEILLEHARRTHCTLGELVLEIGGLIGGKRKPLEIEGDVQRIESEKRAVQIMTIHKAKGLEAAVVFVAGGAHKSRGGDTVHVFHEGGRRLGWAGALAPGVKEGIREEERQEDQRLMYVALTRAKARLYLPCAMKGPSPHTLTGPYQVVNRRLVTLVRERPEWLSLEDVAPEKVETTSSRPGPVPVASLQALGLLARKPSEPAYQELRDARAGTFVTSYTRMQNVRSRGSGWAEHAEARRAEKVAGSVDGAQGRPLPGSRASGVFLHELLERVPLASFEGTSFDAWCARPDVARLLGEAMAVHRVAPAARERAARMIWAAFTTPMTLPDGQRLDGLARADHHAREMDFVYPLPGSDQGFVRGSLDLAFDLGGKTYFVDYKSDTLASYAPAALEAHVRAHYEDQIRLYSIAVARLLGVGDAAAHERRFGGLVYMFLRGLETADRGLWSSRPAWDDVARWQSDLESGSGWGAAANARHR